MATYIIGDLQGCFDELQQLLAQIDYQPNQDELWFVGDIINRGPKSLECLRFVKHCVEHENGKMVLGNHDFHLLASYAGLQKYLSKSDTIEQILNAPDVEELVNWLRMQPLFVEHPVYAAVMVHAGVPPQWSISQAKALAREAEVHLQNADWQVFLREHLFGNQSDTWCDSLQGWPRIRYIVNAFVRMRYCDAQGKLDFKLKSAPESYIKKLKAHQSVTVEELIVSETNQPWFIWPNRKNRDTQIFFGHWSTLGAIDAYGIHATDTGCLWGGQLTAYELESKQRHCIDCPQQRKPKKQKAKNSESPASDKLEEKQ